MGFDDEFGPRDDYFRADHQHEMTADRGSMDSNSAKPETNHGPEEMDVRGTARSGKQGRTQTRGELRGEQGCGPPKNGEVHEAHGGMLNPR